MPTDPIGKRNDGVPCKRFRARSSHPRVWAAILFRLHQLRRSKSAAVPNSASGQVAQVVERSPEKAGVGGSSPSLATIIFKGLADQLEISRL